MTTTAQPTAAPAREPTDDEAISALADRIPGSTHRNGRRTILGDGIYTAIHTAVINERKRAAGVVKAIRDQAANVSRQAAAAARTAQVMGNSVEHQQATAVGQQSASIATALNGVMRLIETPPGVCKTCQGERKVRPRAVVAAADVRIPCPDCAPAEGTARA